MYNRYIPQPDGSFHRNRIADPPPLSHHPAVSSAPAEQHGTPVLQDPPRIRPAASMRPAPPRQNYPRETTNVGSFLRQLLPKGFDTEDLLIVLLLLLMSGDCQKDQNTALLTLVLYLFM